MPHFYAQNCENAAKLNKRHKCQSAAKIFNPTNFQVLRMCLFISTFSLQLAYVYPSFVTFEILRFTIFSHRNSLPPTCSQTQFRTSQPAADHVFLNIILSLYVIVTALPRPQHPHRSMALYRLYIIPCYSSPSTAAPTQKHGCPLGRAHYIGCISFLVTALPRPQHPHRSMAVHLVGLII